MKINKRSIGKKAIAGGMGGVVSYPILTPRDKWSVWGFIKNIAVGVGAGVVVGIAVDAVWPS